MPGWLKPAQVQYVGGYRDGETTDLTGSPLRVARVRPCEHPEEQHCKCPMQPRIVYDHYQLVNLGPGAFIYRHQGEEDGENE
jgi:hypothetical protein